MRKILTLAIPYKPPRILLGMKKRGFGKNRWNGFGGKVKNGEKVEEAAQRELSEESGITAESVELLGILEFKFNNKPGEILEGHIFKVENFSGEPKESEEMKPSWFNIDEIPYDQMWPDDKYWLPLFLTGKKFRGSFLFDDKDNILNFTLKEEYI